MPCTHTGSIEGDTIETLTEMLDDMTDRLCRTMKTLETDTPGDFGSGAARIDLLPKDIQRWWKRHKREDAKKAKAALKKKGR